jgi:hypothetical protein
MSETIKRHDYKRSPHSGAGNCECGWARDTIVHPHRWVPAYMDPLRCVCGKFVNHNIHVR